MGRGGIGGGEKGEGSRGGVGRGGIGGGEKGEGSRGGVGRGGIGGGEKGEGSYSLLIQTNHCLLLNFALSELCHCDNHFNPPPPPPRVSIP